MTDSPTDTRPGGLSVQGTAIVGVGLLIAQVISMLQMLVVSRLMPPEEFGAFGALAVLLLLGGTTMAATQVVIARHVASGGSAAHISRRTILLVGVITFAMTAALAIPLSRMLNLPDAVGVILVGLTFIPFTFTGAQLGLLQGAERHLRLGVLYVIASAARVTGGVLGAALGRDADSAVLGLAGGVLAGALLGQLMLRGLPPWGGQEEGTRKLLGEVGHAAHALIALYALTNLDILIARGRLSAYDAGLYAAGALVARAVFFLPQAILISAFPRMVAGARNAQRQAVAAVAALGLLATAGVAILPGLTIAILVGGQYEQVAADAWIFALDGAGFGVVQVLLYARMARHDRRATLLLWGGVVALLVVGLALGDSVRALALCTAGVAWTVALVGLIWARRGPVSAAANPTGEPA